MNTKKGIILNIFWILLGVILITVSEIGMINDMYVGMGGGFIGVGLYQLFRVFRYNKNEDYKEKIDIEISDERNQYIRLKSWSWTGYITVLVLGIVTIVCMILSLEIYMQIAAMTECFILIVYYISYMIIKKKY